MRTKTQDFVLNQQSFEKKELILPSSAKPMSLAVKHSIREKLLQVEKQPKYLIKKRFPPELPYFGVSLIPLVICFFIGNTMSAMGFAFLSCIIGMLMFWEDRTDLKTSEMEEMEAVSKYNPEIAKHINEVEQSGRAFQFKDYKYLNIAEQFDILRNELCKQQLQAIVNAPLSGESEFYREKLKHITLDQYQSFESQKPFLRKLKRINWILFTGIVASILFLNLSGFDFEILTRVAMFFGCMVTLLYIAVSLLYIMEFTSEHKDPIYDSENYERLYQLSQYKPEIRNYVKQVIEENRLLTKADLNRLKYSEMLDHIEYLKSMASIRNRSY